MLSYKTLVDEVARATGLGKNAQTFLGVVADYIFKQPGGISGFRDKFKNAGLGDIFDSWLSGNPTYAASTRARSAARWAEKPYRTSRTSPAHPLRWCPPCLQPRFPC